MKAFTPRCASTSRDNDVEGRWERDMLTSRQKMLVRKSFERVAPVCLAAADLFYDRLFVLDPTLPALFTGDMAEQRRKLTQMLAAVVENLDHLERVVPSVEALGSRHVAYGAQPEH